MDETKFPESFAKRLENQGKDIDNETTPIYISRIADVYMKNPVDRWFKQCLDDIPVIPLEPTKAELWEFVNKSYLWFEKWFSQFEVKGE